MTNITPQQMRELAGLDALDYRFHMNDIRAALRTAADQLEAVQRELLDSVTREWHNTRIRQAWREGHNAKPYAENPYPAPRASGAVDANWHSLDAVTGHAAHCNTQTIQGVGCDCRLTADTAPQEGRDE